MTGITIFLVLQVENLSLPYLLLRFPHAIVNYKAPKFFPICPLHFFLSCPSLDPDSGGGPQAWVTLRSSWDFLLPSQPFQLTLPSMSPPYSKYRTWY